MANRILAIVVGLFAMLCSNAAAQTVRAQITQSVLNYKTVQPGQQAVIGIVVNINPGFHSQSHTPSDENYIPFVAKLTADPAVSAFEPIYPAGTNHTYRVGKLNTYEGKVIVYFPVEIKSDAKPGPLKLSGSVRWQICDEDKCFAPETKKFTVESEIVAAGQPIQTQYPEVFEKFDPKVFSRLKGATTVPAGAQQPPAAAQGSSSDLTFVGFTIGQHSYGLAFLAAFIAGIMFNAVPCVLPVVPLKIMGFYNAAQHSRARSIAFGATFSAGIVFTFAILAMIVLIGGYGWGKFYSKPALNIGLIILLLIFAIGTFGLFTINVPTSVYRVAPRHDTYWGNFLFGILTAILSTPCTFGLFFGLLIWAAAQPHTIGVGLVMTVGFGMAFPYLVLSAYPEVARKMPRGGPWGELFKQEMGFLLLGSAVFFARRFIQPVIGEDGFWWSLFAVAAGAGLFLVIRTIQFSPRAVPRLVAGAVCAITLAASLAVTLRLVNQPFKWTPYTQDSLNEARHANRIVVVEFTATWCANCQVVETHTLHDPSIVKTVKQQNVKMIKADLTSEMDPGWVLLKQLNSVAAIPFTAVYGPQSSEPIKLEGIYSADNLRSAISRAAGDNTRVAQASSL